MRSVHHTNQPLKSPLMDWTYILHRSTIQYEETRKTSITRLMKTLVARWAHLATPWSILMLMLQRICLYFTFMIMRTFIRMRGIQTQVSGMACLDLWVLNLQSADHVRCGLLLVLAAGWGQEVAIYVRFLSFSLTCRSILGCYDKSTVE